MATATKSNTTISLDSGLLAAAKKEAARQRRTLSAQLEQWVEEKLTASTAKKAAR